MAKPKMFGVVQRPTNPSEEECIRRLQNIAAIVWRANAQYRDMGIHLHATAGLTARHYAAARARMGLVATDYDHP